MTEFSLYSVSIDWIVSKDHCFVQGEEQCQNFRQVSEPGSKVLGCYFL